MVELSVGSIVFIPFPFSDLSATKLRPALVIGRSDRGDWVLCQITSKSYSDRQAIQISSGDFKQGSLSIDSYVRPRKIFTAHYSIIKKQVALLSDNKHAVVIAEIKKMLDDL